MYITRPPGEQYPPINKMVSGGGLYRCVKLNIHITNLTNQTII